MCNSGISKPLYHIAVQTRGGGGGYIHMYAYWVCAARETPIFSPEFPFRSISFSQITKKSVPEHHHFTFFGGFCRSGDHHFQNFFNFNPFIASHGRCDGRYGSIGRYRSRYQIRRRIPFSLADMVLAGTTSAVWHTAENVTWQIWFFVSPWANVK